MISLFWTDNASVTDSNLWWEATTSITDLKRLLCDASIENLLHAWKSGQCGVEKPSEDDEARLMIFTFEDAEPLRVSLKICSEVQTAHRRKNFMQQVSHQPLISISMQVTIVKLLRLRFDVL